MGCPCSNRWTTWSTIDDVDLVMLEVSSRCEAAPILVLQRPPGEGVQPAPAEEGVPVSGPCRVIYEIKNYNGVDYAVASFSSGDQTWTFAPPLEPGKTKTIKKNASLGVRSECYTARTGVLELVHLVSGVRQTLSEIRICRLREVE
jgi:hypothetical protein